MELEFEITLKVNTELEMKSNFNSLKNCSLEFQKDSKLDKK